jgi:hypothetical protein
MTEIHSLFDSTDDMLKSTSCLYKVTNLDSGSRPAARVLAGMTNYDTVSKGWGLSEARARDCQEKTVSFHQSQQKSVCPLSPFRGTS